MDPVALTVLIIILVLAGGVIWAMNWQPDPIGPDPNHGKPGTARSGTLHDHLEGTQRTDDAESMFDPPVDEGDDSEDQPASQDDYHHDDVEEAFQDGSDFADPGDDVADFPDEFPGNMPHKKILERQASMSEVCDTIRVHGKEGLSEVYDQIGEKRAEKINSFLNSRNII